MHTISDLTESDESDLLNAKGVSESLLEKIYTAVEAFIEREIPQDEDDLPSDIVDIALDSEGKSEAENNENIEEEVK